MARKRQIDPCFWPSEQVTNLSFPARLLFIGLINHADDEGYIKAGNKFLKSTIFPADTLPLELIQMWRDEIIIQKLAVFYIHEGNEYIYLPTFVKHQYMTKRTPSKFPKPTPENTKLLTSYQPVINRLYYNGVINQLLTGYHHECAYDGLLTIPQPVINQLYHNDNGIGDGGGGGDDDGGGNGIRSNVVGNNSDVKPIDTLSNTSKNNFSENDKNSFSGEVSNSVVKNNGHNKAKSKVKKE